MRTERGKNFIFSALSVVALWLIWIVAYFAVGDDYVLPSAWDTLAQTGKLLTDAEFWRAFAGTLLRAFSAFAFSALAGIALALAATLYGGAGEAAPLHLQQCKPDRPPLQ